MKKKILQLALGILIVMGLSYFCDAQTKGFRLQEILSDIPNDSEWEVEPLSSNDHKEVLQKLNQTFRYLGSGDQSHAFLGEDQKTVLKFFRHNDLSLLKILSKFPGSIDTWLWHLIKKYDPRMVFESCKLAYQEIQDQTGISCLHLNKTEGQFRSVVLVDNGGIAYTIDLDKTEFMVQDYCELATSRIDARMKKGDIQGAQAAVVSLFQAIEEWSRKGVHIDNPALKRNIGFCGDKVIMLDVGSLKKDEVLMTQDQIKKEVKHVTRSLGRWIYKKHPTLFPSFEQELGEKIIP